MSNLRAIDLFAGIGGIRLGFEQAFGKSIDTVFVSELSKESQKTYKTNFSDELIIAGDITKVDEKEVPDFDVCLAGFPCQAFSMAGKREGFNDDYHGVCRGTLFLDVARICDFHKPKVIFCENVKGLYSHDKGNTLKVILQTFSDLGYTVFHKLLNSKYFGVPQRRERIYIVAFRNDVAPENFEFPAPFEKEATLSDIIEKEAVPAKYYLSETYLNGLIRHRKEQEKKGNNFGYEILDLNGISNTIVCGGMGRERNLIIDHKQKDLTPTTNIKGNINDQGVRKLTPREWARLQGFPENYRLELADTHIYKQLGNSVTVSVIKAIAEKIKSALNH